MKPRAKRTLLALVGVLAVYLLLWFLTATRGTGEILRDVAARYTPAELLRTNIHASSPCPFIVRLVVVVNQPDEYRFGQNYYFWCFGFSKPL